MEPREEFFRRVAEEIKKQLAERVRQAKEQAQAEKKQNPFAKIESERSIMVVCLN